MTALVRYPDWRARLIAYLGKVSHQPFEDGVNDCALFAAGGVLAMTGTDYAAGFRGRYTTLRGGYRILRRAGFADHIALARSRLPARPAPFAQEGDVAHVRTGDGDALGIVQGAGIYVLRPIGLGIVPLDRALGAMVV